MFSALPSIGDSAAGIAAFGPYTATLDILEALPE